MANLYIADLHFGHKNVIKFDNRPFSSIEEMDSQLIKNWNEVVENKDHVYILGDFSWYTAEPTKEILRQLKGNKHLIIGNHDMALLKTDTKGLLEEKTYYKEVKEDGKVVCLSHYPILLYRKHRYPDGVHLFGHVHTTEEYNYIKKQLRILRTYPGINSLANCHNVGCMLDYMDYRPQPLKEILKQSTWE